MARKATTGIALRDKSLEWFTLRTGEKHAEESTAQNATLDLGDLPGLIEAMQGDSGKTAAEIRSRCGHISGQIALGIPASLGLARVLTIPVGTPEEIRGMVELQVDKFSPFPIENTVVSYEILHERDGHAQVMIAVIRNETMELFGSVFKAAGLPLTRVDISPLGWWHLIRQVPGLIHALGRQLFIFFEGNTCDLLLTHEGVPILFRSVGDLRILTPEELTDEIVREAAATLASLEAEFGGQMAPVSFWYRNDEPTAIVAQLRQDLGLEVHATSLSSLPPLSRGLAERAALPDGQALDLTPPAWHIAETNLLFRRRLLCATLAVLAVWILGMLGLFGGLYLQRQKLVSINNRLTQLKEPAEYVRETMKRARSLEEYNDRSHSALECMLEITRLMPDGITLKSLSYRRGKLMELKGDAPGVAQVYSYKEGLDKSAIFTKAELGRIVTTPNGVVFTVTLKLPEVGE